MTRPKMHDFIQTQDEVLARSAEVFGMLRRKEVAFTIQDTIPFTRDGVIRGTRLLQERKTVGKILFDIKGGLASKRAAAKVVMASRKASSPEKRLSNLSAGEAPRTIADAYVAQEFVRDIILEEGEGKEGGEPGRRRIGYKIAATSSMAQASVAVTEPFFGSLFSHSTFASPATIAVGDATLGLQDKFLLIEPEFALRMKEDLEVRTDHTFESILGHIGSIVPSVEIVTSAFTVDSLEDFKNLGARSLIVDNASHGGLVLGGEFSGETEGEGGGADGGGDGGGEGFTDVLRALDTQRISLEVNGEPVAKGSGDKVLGHPVHALCWLANALGKQGKMLRKGDLITTGVVVDGLIVVKSGDEVAVDYGGGHPFGDVRFRFVD